MPLSSASLMPVNEVLVLHVIVDRADPSHQVMLALYSSVMPQECRVALDV
jgi:hypothetical protein